MKVGVIVPTRNDRPILEKNCRRLISYQTRQPDELIFVDYAPKSSEPDLTQRVRYGVSELMNKVDLILIIENDDWYAPDYIEYMCNEWSKSKPDMIGLGKTMYYNIIKNEYAEFSHRGRASLMSTGISSEYAKRIKWPADNYVWLDMELFAGAKTVHTPMPENWYAIGIKHGIGLCGGAGHTEKWHRYSKQDLDYKMLESLTDKEQVRICEAAKHAKGYLFSGERFVKNPFLSIVTRRYMGARESLFAKHQESIKSMTNKSMEQIFIIDYIGQGVQSANRSFEYAGHLLTGKYVFLLDDDDFITNPEMIADLENVKGDPDVIFFKMHINNKNNCLYPTPNCWGDKPIQGSIGGSCFVVKRELWLKHIHKFGEPKTMGDFCFINSVWSEPNLKAVWLDVKMCETGRVSRGAK